MDGSDIDDAPPVAALHRRKCGANGMKCSRQINRNDSVPAIGRKLLDRSDILDTCVIDENIDRSEPVFGVADKRGALFGIGEVGRVVENLRLMLLPKTLRKRLGLVRRGDAVDDQTAAGAGESLCKAKADP
jgi:hypothetical protein